MEEFAVKRKSGALLMLLIGLASAACGTEVTLPTLAPKADLPPLINYQEGESSITRTVAITESELLDEDAIETTAKEAESESRAIGPIISGETLTSDERAASGESDAAAESGEVQDDDFAGVEWKWLSYQDSEGENIISLSEPDRYTLEFNSDATFVYQADCNQGSGEYQISGAQIRLELGAVTLINCSEGSHADQFILLLRDVASYDPHDGQLELYLESGSGVLLFGRAGHSAPESSEIAPVGIEWHWASFSDPALGPQTIQDPENYFFVLLEDGQVSVEADCNQAAGHYRLEGSAASISVDPLTNNDCSPGSMGDQFIRHLNLAAIYFVEDGALYLDLIYDSGTMQFVKGS